MYVDKLIHTSNGKTYTQYLLRESKREGKKTIKKTILNITHWGEEVCEVIRFALGNKKRLREFGIVPTEFQKIVDDLQLTQDKSIGDVWLLHQMSMKNGLIDALGDTREGRLALWQIIARTLDQGSRLSAVRLAKTRETDFLRLGKFSENDLYKNLDWLADNQARIEKALYKKRHGNKPCKLFLYDVTSSYFEGVQNELANYGYNRDQKRNKMQIVVGMLCDDDGIPVAVEVFEGNTSDVSTFHSQVRKVADRFRVEQVVFVGDRGMIKSVQQKELTENDFAYITALTKPQIEKLIDNGTIQLELFDENICEVVHASSSASSSTSSKRYIMRRNPVRAEEIVASRNSKLQSLLAFVSKQNEYLQKHARSKTEIALRYVQQRALRLKIDKWIACEVDETTRQIDVRVDESKLKEISLLDGCYCLTTNLSAEEMDKESVHARYKDLSMVEEAFRTCKTGHLELRPIFVQKDCRTRGHVFVVMLSYLLVQELRESWRGLDATVEENLSVLSSLCGMRMSVESGREIFIVPRPRVDLGRLFSLAGVQVPTVLPSGSTIADSNRKLPSRRKSKK